MYDKNKKVICIKGDKTKAYSQVIFIMKENKPKPVVDFVSEAEKIIDGYMNKKREIIRQEVNNAHIQEEAGVKKLVIKKSNAEDLMLNGIILFSCVGLLVFLFYFGGVMGV